MPVVVKEDDFAAASNVGDAVLDVLFPDESKVSEESSSSSSSRTTTIQQHLWSTTTTKRKTTKILLLVLSLCCCCCLLLLLSAALRSFTSFQKGGGHFKRSLLPPRSTLKEEGDVHHQRPRLLPRSTLKEEGDVHHQRPRLPYNVSFDSNAIVVTACVGRHERLKELSESNKETYARAHDFDFVSGSAEQYPAMTFVQPFAWFKVALLLDVMKIVRAAQTKHEWVLWVDCDALMSKLDENLVRLANRLIEERGKRQNEIDVIVAIDEGETEKINSGVMFIRNSQWSLDFFSTVLRKAEQERLRQHPHWEQAAINELILNKNEAWSGHFLKVKRNQINSFQPEKALSRKHPDNQFRKGETFVVHRVNCHDVTLCDELFKSWFCHVHSEDARFQRKCQNSKSISFFNRID